jgi:hypothetical protein
MSILQILNKIKGFLGIDINGFLYYFLVLIVSVGSFYLGRISISVKIPQNTQIDIPNKEADKTDISNTLDMVISDGVYFASRNGKLYYTKGCNAGNRIAVANRIYFNSKQEAQDAGYIASDSCK